MQACCANGASRPTWQRTPHPVQRAGDIPRTRHWTADAAGHDPALISSRSDHGPIRPLKSCVLLSSVLLCACGQRARSGNNADIDSSPRPKLRQASAAAVCPRGRWVQAYGAGEVAAGAERVHHADEAGALQAARAADARRTGGGLPAFARRADRGQTTSRRAACGHCRDGCAANLIPAADARCSSGCATRRGSLGKTTCTNSRSASRYNPRQYRSGAVCATRTHSTSMAGGSSSGTLRQSAHECAGRRAPTRRLGSHPVRAQRLRVAAAHGGTLFAGWHRADSHTRDPPVDGAVDADVELLDRVITGATPMGPSTWAACGSAWCRILANMDDDTRSPYAAAMDGFVPRAPRSSTWRCRGWPRSRSVSLSVAL